MSRPGRGRSLPMMEIPGSSELSVGERVLVGGLWVEVEVPGVSGLVPPLSLRTSGWPGLVLWTGRFEGCWLLLVVLCPLARVLVG